MNTNKFFSKKCKQIFNHELFGICDKSNDNNSQPSYTDIDNKGDWLAEVVNNKKYEIKFIAIDCVGILRDNREEDESCDAMMIYNNNIVFVELKNSDIKSNASKKERWARKASRQLKNTIKHFEKRYHKLNFNEKIAYASNKNRPIAKNSKIQLKNSFKEETGFTLKIKYSIKL